MYNKKRVTAHHKKESRYVVSKPLSNKDPRRLGLFEDREYEWVKKQEDQIRPIEVTIPIEIWKEIVELKILISNIGNVQRGGVRLIPRLCNGAYIIDVKVGNIHRLLNVDEIVRAAFPNQEVIREIAMLEQNIRRNQDED